MSGLFASLSVGRAWEKLSSFLRVFSMAPSSSSSVSQEEDLEELRKLERTMRRNRATLHDAEEHWNIREESTKLQLKELKEVAYDMEDVVDEYDYEVDRCRLAALDRSAGVHKTGKRKHEEMEAYPVDAGVVVVPTDLLLRARKITERFNEIIHYSEHFSLSENDGERRFAPDLSTLRHTSSVVFDKSIIGREQERDKIIDKLLSRKGENAVNPVSVMPIVGMGGLGKTTLAQLVCNSQRVRQSFENRAWVFVSENFDIKTMTRNIITSITEPGQQCMHSELADLQRKLATVMNGESFPCVG
ncbi:putative disease resistance protein RGA3 [Miscanthus floridulus]|uniref:putative disease resistance protein RGA3 n=1 Tax=Miscanthus floridulus TaxID=154761 RepID=UPI003459A68B